MHGCTSVCITLLAYSSSIISAKLRAHFRLARSHARTEKTIFRMGPPALSLPTSNIVRVCVCVSVVCLRVCLCVFSHSYLVAHAYCRAMVLCNKGRRIGRHPYHVPRCADACLESIVVQAGHPEVIGFSQC